MAKTPAMKLSAVCEQDKRVKKDETMSSTWTAANFVNRNILEERQRLKLEFKNKQPTNDQQGFDLLDMNESVTSAVVAVGM